MSVSSKLGQPSHSSKLGRGLDTIDVDRLGIGISQERPIITDHTGIAENATTAALAGDNPSLVTISGGFARQLGYSVPTGNQINAVPILVTRAATLKRMFTRLYSSTGNAGRGRWGLYSNKSGTMFPKDRLWASSEAVLTFDGGTAPYNTFYSSPDLYFVPGWYWAVSHFNLAIETSTCAVLTCNAVDIPPFAMAGDLQGYSNAARGWVGYRRATAYAELPATFPTTNWTPIDTGAGVLPVFALEWNI